MAMYEFVMSCGHTTKREVADPKKYFKLDAAYYKAQGLCNACWKELHELHERQSSRHGRR